MAAHLENEAGIVGAALAALYQQPGASEPTAEMAQDMPQDTSQDDTSR